MASLSKACIAAPSNVHRLVIVEGIMGSGKSTTMRFIAKHLQDAGRASLPVHERTDPHPVRATDELEHWFEPWMDVSPEDLADRALARWTAFAGNAESEATIPVLDGQLFHGDLTHLLLMEADTALIAGYVHPALGQCYPTSRVVQHYYPGTEIMKGTVWTGDAAEVHFWNGLRVGNDWYHIDLSWQQFPARSVIQEFVVVQRQELNDSGATMQRCALLLTRVEKYLTAHIHRSISIGLMR